MVRHTSFAKIRSGLLACAALACALLGCDRGGGEPGAAEQPPELLRTVLDEYQALSGWEREHTEETSQILARSSGVAYEAFLTSERRRAFGRSLAPWIARRRRPRRARSTLPPWRRRSSRARAASGPPPPGVRAEGRRQTKQP
ncbi:hypothetical protein [Sorangium sp. So ce233]|uniref:hypothetical protein n=1 Tax=Sorangium sp. So ce233 TaxID=3133290 RepID=UPI003F63AB5C